MQTSEIWDLFVHNNMSWDFHLLIEILDFVLDLRGMGIRMQERDIFVVVNYDFEYITEEGKEVWMKEGEILLLLSRTNNDWWQVSWRLELIGS